MSFAGTPLGQGRRLDHSTFLGKTTTTERPIPTSYSFGAPALGTRSPPKATTARERPKSATDHDDPLTTRPEKWSVNDTSVNIASAFYQAASDMTTPNASWASGSTRTNLVPRSTSVEYEAAAPAHRRFPAPPRRLGATVASAAPASGRALTKSVSATIVPDSEGEDNGPPKQRGKTPLQSVVDNASQLLSQTAQSASFYVRQRSQEPSVENVNASYDYSQEERDFQNQKRKATQKRGGISTDNKAYKPSKSDLEDSDEDFNDDDHRRRRAKKKEAGRVSTLPTIGETKRRKKKAKAPKAAGQQGSGDEEEDEDDQHSAHGSHHSSILPRYTSRPPSNPRNSIQPPELQPPDTSIDVEGLQSIPEHEEDSFDELPTPHRRSSSVGIGATLGHGIHKTYRGIGNVLDSGNWGVSAALWFCGRILGSILNVLVMTPIGWFLRGSFNGLFRYLVISLAILGAWYFVQEPMLQLVPSLPSRSYRPPEAPAADISELNTRLLSIENALSSMVKDSDRTRSKVDSEARLHAEVTNRLGQLETKVQRENARNAEAENNYRDAASSSMQALRKEMELLQSHLHKHEPSTQSGSDEEARSKLKALEDRLGSVEGGVKDALELAKAGAKAGSTVASLSWINNLDKKGLSIKSSDGKDVTSIIAQLVKSALSIQSKDILAKPDYALSSTGGRVIPGQTSPSVEVILPEGGKGIGRPPVTALHHELHAGHCWPFGGSSGRLGVALAAPVYISEVAIDHVPKEVAHDMRTAPRAMEVWGQIDGKDNAEKVAAWRAEKASKRQEALKRGEAVEEEVHPKEYPAKLWVKIASFSYNIYDTNHVQTFPVFEEIRALGVDFGIVNLRVLNNWGMEDYTCLYRFRVHGEQLRGPPPPLPEDVLQSS